MITAVPVTAVNRFQTAQVKPAVRFAGEDPKQPENKNLSTTHPSAKSVGIRSRFRNFVNALMIATLGAGAGGGTAYIASQKADDQLYQRLHQEISVTQQQLSEADKALFERLSAQMSDADKLILEQMLSRMSEADKAILAQMAAADQNLHDQILRQMAAADEALQASIMKRVAEADDDLKREIITDMLQKMATADQALEARLYQSMLQQMATQDIKLRTAIAQAINELVRTPISNNQKLQYQLNQLKKMIIFPEVIGHVTQATVKVQGARGHGSGTFIRDAKGDLYVLTNNHVVEDNDIGGKFKILLPTGSDAVPGRVVEGEVVATENKKDLAIIKITTPDFVPPAELGLSQIRDLNKEPLKVGEAVFVIGNPSSMTHSVTVGVVSNVDRENPWNKGQMDVQVDAPINGGNSGGSLYDSQGRLIGVPAWGMRNSDGLGAAIKISTAVEWLKSIGVDIQPPVPGSDA